MIKTDEKYELVLPPAEKKRTAWERVYLQGHTLKDIAADFGVSPQTVGKWVREVLEWSHERFVNVVAEAKAAHAAILERVVQECWVEWHRSKTLYAKTKITREGATDKQADSEETEEIRCADPRYMDTIIKAIKQSSELYPQPKERTEEGIGTAIQVNIQRVNNLVNLDPEEVRALAEAERVIEARLVKEQKAVEAE